MLYGPAAQNIEMRKKKRWGRKIKKEQVGLEYQEEEENKEEEESRTGREGH